MAVVFQEDEEKKKEEQQTQVASGVPAPTGQVAAPQPTRQRRTTQQAPNIQRYLQANVGAGQQLAGGIAERTRQEAEELGEQAGRTREAFETQAKPLEQQLGEQAEQTIQTAFKDPQQLLQQQQQLEQFRKLREGQVAQQAEQLPTDISNLQAQQQQLAQQADLAGTEAGRFQMLQQAYGGPSYTRGQSRLDQLLFQATPGATRRLQQDIRGAVQPVGEQITTAQEEMAARQAALQELAGQRAGEIGQLLQYGAEEEGLEEEVGQRGLSDIEESILARQETLAEEAPERLEAMQARLAQGTPTAEDIEALGLEEGMYLYDVGDLSKYLTQTPSQGTPAGVATDQVTPAGVATEEEFARLRALQQLAGVDEGGFLSGVEEEKIGAYKPFEYDVEDLKQKIAQRRQAFQKHSRDVRNLKGTIQKIADSGIITPELANISDDLGYEDVKQIVKSMEPWAKNIERQYGSISRNVGSMPKAYNRLKDWLQKYKSFQPGRTLRPAPEDIETGGQFGVT